MLLGFVKGEYGLRPYGGAIRQGMLPCPTLLDNARELCSRASRSDPLGGLGRPLRRLWRRCRAKRGFADHVKLTISCVRKCCFQVLLNIPSIR